MVGMSESGIRNLIRRGTLRAVRLDGRWLIPATAIEDKLGVQLDANIAPTPRPTLPTPLRRESPGGAAAPARAIHQGVGPMTHADDSACALLFRSSTRLRGALTGGGGWDVA